MSDQNICLGFQISYKSSCRRGDVRPPLEAAVMSVLGGQIRAMEFAFHKRNADRFFLSAEVEGLSDVRTIEQLVRAMRAAAGVTRVAAMSEDQLGRLSGSPSLTLEKQQVWESIRKLAA